jgi:phage tail protein X
MRKYRTKKGERLDQVVYREYNTLEQSVFNLVLEANTHLSPAVEFEADTIVYLPEIKAEQTSQKGKALW